MGQSKSKSKSKPTRNEKFGPSGPSVQFGQSDQSGQLIFTITGCTQSLVIREPLDIPNIDASPLKELFSNPITLISHSPDYKIQFFTKTEFFQRFIDFSIMNPVYANLTGTGMTIYDQGPVESLTLRAMAPGCQLTMDPSRYHSVKITLDPNTPTTPP